MTISNIIHNIILGIKYESMALGMAVNIFMLVVLIGTIYEYHKKNKGD